jgi:hypothetical protein
MTAEPPQVKVPPFTNHSSGAGAGVGDEDWRIHLYNQERMLVSQEQITDVLQRLLDQQRSLGELSVKLNAHLDAVAQATHEATKATKGLVAGIIKVPVVIVMIGIASWAFYLKFISEHTWLLILAVAVFPYVGESITAIAKLFGMGRHDNGGAK